MKLSVLLPIRVNKTSFGTLEPGKLADIVIAATDPLANIRSLEKRENIKVVMKGGQVLKDIR